MVRVVNLEFSPALFDAQIERFEEAWLDESRRGPPPRIELHLPPAQAACEEACSRRELLVELIMIDLECRWREASPEKRGLVLGGPLSERPRLEDYARTYAELGSLDALPIELIVHEYQVRNLWGDQPDHDEYMRRFRHCDVQLCELLSEADHSTTNQSESPFHCPTCKTRVAIGDDSDLVEVTCASCGSQFSPLGSIFREADEFKLQPFAQFEELKRIGQGSFGSVWRAWDSNLLRWVALKFPRRHLNHEASRRLDSEAKAAAGLDHPNLVRVYDVKNYRVDDDHDILYIVSDYIEGVSFDQWLASHHASPKQAAELCKTIAEALHHAHEKNIIHRDVKPSNIILDANDEPYVTDFGLARRLGSDGSLSTEGRIVGTPAYMSPEMANGSGDIADRRSDIFSLGVVFYEMLTGERPFREGNAKKVHKQVINDDAPAPRSRDARIPRDLETICLKCLKKNPSHRYATAEELSKDLGRFLQGEPIRARRVSRTEKTLKWVRRRPAVAMLIAICALALGAIGGSGWLVYSQAAEYWEDDWRNAGQSVDAVRQHLTLAKERLSKGAYELAEKARKEAQDNIETAKKDLAKAIDNPLARGVELLRDDLAEQIAETRDLARELNERRKALAQYGAIMDLHEAIVKDVSQPVVLDSVDTLQRVRAKALAALTMAGLDKTGEESLLKNDRLNQLGFTRREESEFRNICYELFLLLARSTAGSEDTAEGRDAAIRHLDLLNEFVNRNVLPNHTEAYYLLRDKYSRQLESHENATPSSEHQISAKRTSRSAFDPYLLGRHYLAERSYEKARGSFRHAIDEGHFWAKYWLAICELRDPRGDPRNAKLLLLECLEEEADVDWLRIVCGFACGMAKDIELAEKQFDVVVAKSRKPAEKPFDVVVAKSRKRAEPIEPLLYIYRAVVRAENAKMHEAAHDLRTAIKKLNDQLTSNPDHEAYRQTNEAFLAVAHLNKAFVDAKLNEPVNRVVKHFNTAIALNSKSPRLYRARARYRQREGDVLNALQDYRQALRLEKDQVKKAKDRLHIGDIRLELQDRNEARSDFLAALSLCDAAMTTESDQYGHAHIRVLKGRLLSRLCRRREAIAAFDGAIDIGNDLLTSFNNEHASHHVITMLADALFNRGRLRMESKEYTKALPDLDGYIHLATTAKLDIQLNVHLDRGIAHHQLGNYKEAIDAYTAELSTRRWPIDPQGENDVISRILLLRGRAYLSSVNFGLAKRDFIEATNHGSDDVLAHALSSLSTLEARVGDYDEAINVLTKLIEVAERSNRSALLYDALYARAWARVTKWNGWTNLSKQSYRYAVDDYRAAIRDAKRIHRCGQNESMDNNARVKMMIDVAAVLGQTFNIPEWAHAKISDQNLWHQITQHPGKEIADNQSAARRLMAVAIQLHDSGIERQDAFFTNVIFPDERLRPLWGVGGEDFWRRRLMEEKSNP